MTKHQIVTHDEWITARRRFLAKEKEFTRLRDQLSRERRELPWERVEKNYVFEGEKGRESLAGSAGGLALIELVRYFTSGALIRLGAYGLPLQFAQLGVNLPLLSFR